MRVVSTPHGDVRIVPATEEIVLRLRAVLPLGLVRLSEADATGAAEYGLVMQRGNEELSALKLQPPDYGVECLDSVLESNQGLVCRALAAYRRRGYSGAIFPTPYVRRKGPGLIEPGIAVFAFPAADGPETEEFCPDLLQGLYDDRLGRGFAAMAFAFVRDLASQSAPPPACLDPENFGEAGSAPPSSEEEFVDVLAGPLDDSLPFPAVEPAPHPRRSRGFVEPPPLPPRAWEGEAPLAPYVGIEVRPRRSLGAIRFGFMVVGPHLVHLSSAIHPDDPVWRKLRAYDVDEVIHLHCIPWTLGEGASTPR